MKNPCPHEESLMDYLEGRLSDGDRSQIEEHLSNCQACLEALVVAKAMTDDRDHLELEPVPKGVTQAAVDLVTNLCAKPKVAFTEKLRGSIRSTVSKITDTLQPGPLGVLQPVPIRSSSTVVCDDLVSVTVSFRGMKTEIEMEKAGDGKAHIRVKPLNPKKDAGTLRVNLKAGEREIASYLVEGAYVLFEDIPFGHYSISIVENGEELGAYLFEMKDSQDG